MVYSVFSYLKLTSFKILNDMTFGAIFNSVKKKEKTLSISSEMEKASCLLMISMLLLL